jgi:hypothetical protein
VLIDEVAARFGLGRPVREPARVPGGLSNELWRLDTEQGAFAVKRMVANAARPGFAANVEAAFEVERRAFTAGVPMPEPIPDPATGRALVRIDGDLVRVHRWTDGRPGDGTPAEAAELLAAIHAAGARRWAAAAPPATVRPAERWGSDVAGLARRVEGGGPARALVVDSHGDLDRKNTLRGTGGRLLAVDWDAAGPVAAVHEAVGVALDWSDAGPGAFAEAVGAYRRSSGVAVPPEPWVFAGWVAAQLGWLGFNADERSGTELGASEVTATLARVGTVAATLDALLGALR